MKKAITYAILFAIPSLLFAQSTQNTLPPVQTDYLKKSKNQKTAAWILLGGGTALMTTGVLLAVPKATEELSYGLNQLFSGEPAPEVDYTVENILVITGVAAMLGSIPLFIASGKNKKKSMNLSTKIKMENATIFQKQSFVQSSYPALTFKINL